MRELLATDRAPTALRALGAALATLHAVPVPTDAPVHDAAAEAAVVERWEELAADRPASPGRPVDQLAPRPSGRAYLLDAATAVTSPGTVRQIKE